MVLCQAGLVAAVTAFKGQMGLDPGYPDGALRKLVDISRIIALGWQARTSLDASVKKTDVWVCRTPWAGQPGRVTSSTVLPGRENLDPHSGKKVIITKT